MITVTKTYSDLPAAHRQPNHDGHCRLIHGHNWRFDITFGCDELDENGFVIDVGKLGQVKEFMVAHFDHTLLLNESDPHLNFLKDTLSSSITKGNFPFANIVVVPNCGMEGLAKFVLRSVQGIVNRIPDASQRKVKVLQVTCWEDSKNSSTY